MVKFRKWWDKYVGSLPAAIKWMFCLSLVFVLAYDFALKDLPETFNGQTELGLIMRGLCFVFVTGPTIYFITAHYPQIQARDRTYGLVVQDMDIMLGQVKYNLIGFLEELWGKPFAHDYPGAGEWKEFAGGDYPDIDWNELSVITSELTEDIRRITAIPGLDLDTYTFMFRLENSILFKLSKRTPDAQEPFSSYAPLIKDFLDNCKKLEDYRNTRLKDYLSEIDIR